MALSLVSSCLHTTPMKRTRKNANYSRREAMTPGRRNTPVRCGLLTSLRGARNKMRPLTFLSSEVCMPHGTEEVR
jgi:hypothetical protein